MEQKIVFLDRKTLGDDITLDQFKKYGEVISYESTSNNETIERIGDASIIVTNKVIIDKNVMDNTNLKLICIAATGMNNVDLQYAEQKGIKVKNVAGYSTSSVAQLTFAFALEFIQRISYYDDFGKNRWKHSDIFTHLNKPFYELEGKNWGIIGFGQIGQKVANIAKEFGCNVQYYSTSGKNKNDRFQSLPLDKLLSSSDIISIHAPLNESTLNLINNTNLNTIKKGCILLNLGRGGIVNEKDTSDAINQGEDIYYGTDVVSKEPIEEDNPLLKIKNKDRLIITPHIAWGSKEARIRLLNGIERNIKDFVL